ncbi:uncharacterized protein BP01DRAFT_27913 [Aspergillus saccharolyticus JOP 1030-1]|uniref:PH domain-containing protein n=1 Tax=Aspergillus saccharolyticus JOP 1030-1 TaxID=1450539 RepID=A0A318ZFI5_9EURO|nr:hypothetical protein BP01DRAFT_27913 [Aspergillus saccharolyticus JOP 1030-1]PYH46306.1 hypothetical protein BP01DRAFT_27913 [Aspergillus saccharolyticus JOP 1030-1]
MAMETPDMVAASQHAAPMKFSRYRSVRKAASKQPPSAAAAIPSNFNPPPPPLAHPPIAALPAAVSHDHAANTDAAANNSGNTAIQRSMSRYRRRIPPTAQQPSEAVPTSAPAYKAQVAINGTSVPPPPPYPQERSEDSDMARIRQKLALRLATREKQVPDDSEDEDSERDRHRRNAMDRLTGGEDVSPSNPFETTVREKPAKDVQEKRANDGTVASRRTSREPRRRSLKVATAKPTQVKGSKDDSSASSPAETSPVAQFPDAPVSAVNARERRVLVQYRKTSMKICVNPSTSAQDILTTGMNYMAKGEDPGKFILMESFADLGLERPLRRYECVRDVMNSWAHDEQNSLIIVPAASLDALALLDAQNVSQSQPTDATFYLYYSQRPRKWDKRYVTLRSDGQVTISKKETGQDHTNVCHLSDFDIYSPTASSLANNVKPPKKFCQAIKSQQKSTMFLTTENFVHYFSSNDRDMADNWHKAVQTWRSWYLVNMRGVGKSSETDNTTSSDESYRAGKRSQKPLLNPFEETSNEVKAPAMFAVERTQSKKVKELFSHKKSTRERGPPPTSFPKILTGEADLTAESSDEATFSASGLLGRTYTMRQRAMKEREEQEKRDNEERLRQGLVGTMGARRVHAGPSSRSNTMTSTHAPDFSAVKRSQSVKAKPLVDLTPVYGEPPQHIRKGRGVTVDPGVPLIDAATGPEAPGGIQIPSATTWRRPPMPAEPMSAIEPRTRKRSNTARSINGQQRYHHTAPNTPISPVELPSVRDGPFLPHGLLARAQPAPAPGPPVGHGVATGDRNATKPMLDMSPENPFAEGSLLRGL